MKITRNFFIVNKIYFIFDSNSKYTKIVIRTNKQKKTKTESVKQSVKRTKKNIKVKKPKFYTFVLKT